jgi:hypothetical protein
MTVTQALQTVTPVVMQLQKQMDDAGYTGGAAFAQIQQYAAMAGDEIAGPALDAVGYLNEGLVGLHNSGLLNQEMFVGLAGQVADTFNSLVEQGYDGNAALQLMQPTLQTIWELQQDFGYQVDENTQRMLDGAQTAGLVGDAHRDANERIASALEEVAKLLGDFISLFGEIPKGAQEAAGGVESALNGIEVNPVVVKYRFEPENTLPNGNGGGYHEFAEGGIVTRPTYGVFGEAGPEAVMPLDRVSDFIAEAGGGRDDEILEAIEALRADFARFPQEMARASRDYRMTRPR